MQKKSGESSGLVPEGDSGTFSISIDKDEINITLESWGSPTDFRRNQN